MSIPVVEKRRRQKRGQTRSFKKDNRVWVSIVIAGNIVINLKTIPPPPLYERELLAFDKPMQLIVTQLPEATVHSICIKPIKPDHAYELWRQQSSKEGQGEEEKRRNKTLHLINPICAILFYLFSFLPFLSSSLPRHHAERLP